MDGNFRRTERAPTPEQGDPYRIEHVKKTDWTAVTIRMLVVVVLLGGAVAGYFYMREQAPAQSPFTAQTQDSDALTPPSFPPAPLPEADAENGAQPETSAPTGRVAEPSSAPAPVNRTPRAVEPTPPPVVNEAPSPTTDPLPLDEPPPIVSEPPPVTPQY